MDHEGYRNDSSSRSFHHQPDSFVSHQQQAQQQPNRAQAGNTEDHCNCKKSKCLKLYCQCFAVCQLCTSKCTCVGCHNSGAHAAERARAIAAILERNPSAFDTKFEPVTGPATLAAAGHKTGCKCKKSACLKKYCECFNAGVRCHNRCCCTGCLNTVDGKMKVSPGPPPPSGGPSNTASPVGYGLPPAYPMISPGRSLPPPSMMAAAGSPRAGPPPSPLFRGAARGGGGGGGPPRSPAPGLGPPALWPYLAGGGAAPGPPLSAQGSPALDLAKQLAAGTRHVHPSGARRPSPSLGALSPPREQPPLSPALAASPPRPLPPPHPSGGGGALGAGGGGGSGGGPGSSGRKRGAAALTALRGAASPGGAGAFAGSGGPAGGPEDSRLLEAAVDLASLKYMFKGMAKSHGSDYSSNPYRDSPYRTSSLSDFSLEESVGPPPDPAARYLPPVLLPRGGGGGGGNKRRKARKAPSPARAEAGGPPPPPHGAGLLYTPGMWQWRQVPAPGRPTSHQQTNPEDGKISNTRHQPPLQTQCMSFKHESSEEGEALAGSRNTPSSSSNKVFFGSGQPGASVSPQNCSPRVSDKPITVSPQTAAIS